jgi:DNA-binding response OmpR family regulator
MDQSGLKILLIDDDRNFISAVARQLKDEFHHQTFITHNGNDAIRMLGQMTSGIDLIFVDNEMPEMNGLDFLRWKKEHHQITPVVMLTATGSEFVAVEAMKLGAYDYVRKEHLDFNHLGRVIDATHERHMFRVALEFEAEHLKEIGLNRQATDKARDVLNTITPPLHTAVANINFELEVKAEEILAGLSPSSRESVVKLIQEVLKEVRVLEMSIRGILSLYRILYAHHGGENELDEIRQDMEKQLGRKRDG